MSPEMMQRAENDATTMVVDGPKCDVFSFAVLSLYAVTGVMPHEGLDNKKIFLKVSVQGGGFGELTTVTVAWDLCWNM